MSATPEQDHETTTSRRCIGPAALVAAAVVFIGAAVVTAIVTWHWESQIVALGFLLAAGTCLVVATLLVIAEDLRHIVCRRCDDLSSRLDELGGQVGDGRWIGWAQRLAEEPGEAPLRVTSIRRNGR